MTDNYSITQQDYLGLAVYGFNSHKAQTMLGIAVSNITGWRGNKCEGFKEVEDFLRDHNGDYYNQVNDYFARKIAMFDFGAMQIASKILKWDDLDDKEKGRVWTAYAFLKNNVKKNVGNTDYETKLLNERK